LFFSGGSPSEYSATLSPLTQFGFKPRDMLIDEGERKPGPHAALLDTEFAINDFRCSHEATLNDNPKF
jgi:hypothetical protein